MSLCEERKPVSETPKIHANPERYFIEKQTEAFLAKGLNIIEIPSGVTGIKDINGVSIYNIAGGNAELKEEDMKKSAENRVQKLRKTRSSSGHLYIHWIKGEKRYHFSIGNETYYRDADKKVCVEFRNEWMTERGMTIPD